VTRVLVIVAETLLAVALAPALVGFIRWCKARLQGRRGAPPWQPYREISKLFRKECVVSHTASWIFHVTPFVVFGTGVVAVSLVPLLRPVRRGLGDLFALVYPRSSGRSSRRSPGWTRARRLAAWGRRGR
jgi:formate hydrogenlyase subunit 4